jgi:hypothetical protein
MTARRAATLISAGILVLGAPVIFLTALALVVEATRYRVDSSSTSPDGRFRIDNERATTFDHSYQRVRLVRRADGADRTFCAGAGGSLVGTFTGNDALVITFPDTVGQAPDPKVVSERIQFDPDDLDRADVTLLGGATEC